MHICKWFQISKKTTYMKFHNVRFYYRDFLVFILFTVIPVSARSQSYIPMLTDSIYWDVAYADMFAPLCEAYGNQGAGPYRYALDGDTIINGINYKKFKSYSFFTLLTQPSPNCPPFAIDTFPSLNPHNSYFMREDTVNKKVFLIGQNIPQEILWYDFDAQVGDTLLYPNWGNFIIDTIFTIISLDGKTRKYFDCIDSIGFYCGYYIEGIGGTMGPFHDPFHYFEFGPWLMCVSDYNQNPIFSPNMCYNFTTGVNSDIDYVNTISMFPNPATDFLYFNFLEKGQRIILFNSHGKKVADHINKGDNQIPVSTLAEGLYFVYIVKDTILYPIGKFIKL
jgi:hypothetical protein